MFMMLTKEHEIIRLFIAKPWLKLRLSQVLKALRMKSKSYVHAALKEFVKKGVLREEKSLNASIYSLDLSNPAAQAYAGFIAEYMAWNEKHLPMDDLKRIIAKIPTSFFIFLITGSYAKKAQRKDSDIDVVVICDNSVDPKKIYAELSHECDMSMPPAHLYVFRESELLLMLQNDEPNYGKEMAKNLFLLYGGESYFRIMSEAIKHGFNG